MLSVASLLISAMAFIVSYIALVYTARPRVRVSLLNGQGVSPDQVVVLKFRVTMRSRLKRAASDMRIFVNFTSELEPIDVSFGSAFELSDSSVINGKGGSRYLLVTGVRVSKEEPIPYEDFVARIHTPKESGTYHGWTTCFAHGSVDDCGVSHFQVEVLVPQTG